jgi:2',3'-cyclic-nucleotide 2'-phosphodiesterase/3'-nucleotidase
MDQPLLDPLFPGYNFDMIAGLEYLIDPTQPARFDTRGRLADPSARRIRDLCHNGRPIDPDAEFVVATNNYRIATWDVLSGPGIDHLDIGRPVGVRGLLAAWFGAGLNLGLDISPAWRLWLPPDTGVVLHTARQADPADLIGHGLHGQHLGQTPDGFSRVLLTAAPAGGSPSTANF